MKAGDGKIENIFLKFKKNNVGTGDLIQDNKTLTYEQVDLLSKQLPAFKKVLDGLENYVFSSSIISSEDKDINEYFNFDITSKLREIFRATLVYGSCGVRQLSKGIDIIPKNRYDIIVTESDTDKFKYEPIIFLLSRYLEIDGETTVFKHRDEVSDSRFSINEKGELIGSENWMAFSNEDFLHFSNNETINGTSIFEYDRKRAVLILALYDYYIHDFNRNGIGTIAFKYNESLLSKLASDELPISTTKIFDESIEFQKNNEEDKQKKIQALSDTLSEIQYEDSIIYSDDFDDLQQIQRDSKPSDFIDFIQQISIDYITQLFNVNPQVFDFESAGNIGKEEIIKDFIIHRIIPMREKFESIINRLTCFLGINQTFNFKNEELSDYHNFNDDLLVLSVYEKLIELNKNDEAEKFLQNNLFKSNEVKKINDK